MTEKQERARDNARRGLDQVGVRAFNERLVLSLVRDSGRMARADIARRTGLSAQTISVIIRALEQDGLLERGKPIKGKVGQPLVPMSIAPEGAYAVGVKVGRRSIELVLMNLVGEVVDQLRETYRYPLPAPILEFVKRSTDTITAKLTLARRSRIVGLGIATPFQLWNWTEKVGASAREMDQWRTCDLAQRLQSDLPYPIHLENDVSAACGAELMFGHGRQHSNFLYFFIGSFIGGGVVLGGALYSGANGNAGAVGSMPSRLPTGQTGQLIDVASLFLLENQLRIRGIDPISSLDDQATWTGFEAELSKWIAATARHLAKAIVAACAILDLPTIVVDGGFPAPVKERLVAATRAEMTKVDLRGLFEPEILPGLVGPKARAIGGASLPLIDRFLLDQSLVARGASA